MCPFSLKEPNPQTKLRSSPGSEASAPLHCSAAVKALKKAETEQLRHVVSTGASKGQSRMTLVLYRTYWDPLEGALEAVCSW